MVKRLSKIIVEILKNCEINPSLHFKTNCLGIFVYCCKKAACNCILRQIHVAVKCTILLSYRFRIENMRLSRSVTLFVAFVLLQVSKYVSIIETGYKCVVILPL